MKLFSLILSVIVFFISLYFFVLELPVSDALNDMIYVSLLVILMAICIVGIIINWSFFRRKGKGPTVFFIANRFSSKAK
jgi:hypothetical protein